MKATIFRDPASPVEYADVELDSDVFPEIGADMEWSARVVFGEVCNAQARLFRIRPAVDFATEWLKKKRTKS